MATCLILGGAACVWKDAKLALRMFTPDVVIAINDMIAQWPTRIDYACTLHPEKLAQWLADRKANGYSAVTETWSHRNQAALRGGAQYPAVKHVAVDWSGSSGLFAVKVARLEKLAPIILAGVPLVNTESHFVRERPWGAASAFHGGWRKRQKEIAPYVRSMSGWTAELLGKPTVGWLQDAATSAGRNR